MTESYKEISVSEVFEKSILLFKENAFLFLSLTASSCILPIVINQFARHKLAWGLFGSISSLWCMMAIIIAAFLIVWFEPSFYRSDATEFIKEWRSVPILFENRIHGTRPPHWTVSQSKTENGNFALKGRLDDRIAYRVSLRRLPLISKDENGLRDYVLENARTKLYKPEKYQVSPAQNLTIHQQSWVRLELDDPSHRYHDSWEYYYTVIGPDVLLLTCQFYGYTASYPNREADIQKLIVDLNLHTE